MAAESKLERYLVKRCRKLGILCYKFVSPGRRGVPDRILLFQGKVVFLELKALGKIPSRLQIREIYLIREQSVHAAWATMPHEIELTLSRLIT